MNKPSAQRKKSGWWFIGAIGVFLLSKAKSILAVLKVSKFGFAFVSMMVTVAAYAYAFSLPFAIGLVLMIFIHEMGHVIAAKQKGLPVTAPIFIPFLGALIMMKRNPRDAVTEAYIALGGPLLGSIAAFLLFAIGVQWDIAWCIVVAYVGCFLNAINLLPIHPLDGGRITTAVTRWLWLAGLVGGLALIVYMRSILFFIIWLMFAWELYQKYVKRRGRGKLQSVPGTVQVPLDGIEQLGMFIPGEDHQRNLPFTTYSKMNGEQRVEFDWPMIGLHGVTTLPQQGIVHRVRVSRIERVPQEAPERLVVHCRIDYETYENDAYYEVPTPIRWKFGLAYGGLALALISVMLIIQQMDLQVQ